MSAKAVLALAAAALVASSCGGGDADAGPSATASKTTLRVYAATSLRAAFTELESDLESSGGDIDVELTFGGSSGLAAQIGQGAPAHVFASADEQTMQLVVDDEEPAAEPTVFARNRLAVVVERGNPEDVRGLRDLARRDLVVVLCAPAVPCGRLAAAALAKSGIEVTARSLEEHVGSVRSKVELGEADAGIVYLTDALDAGSTLTHVDDPLFDDPDLEAVYLMAVLDGAPAAAARSWMQHVRSRAGRSILERRGFLAP